MASNSPNSVDEFRYQVEMDLPVEQFIDILHRSTLAQRRPVHDIEKMQGMLAHATIVLTARNQAGLLVGVSRAISDRNYCTYLSDLAVDQAYQNRGIGRELVKQTHLEAGLHTLLILLAAPNAREYYGKIGMRQHDSCWVFDRVLPVSSTKN